MITLPLALIDREDLSLMERALLPLIARHTQQWGDKPGDIDASTLAQVIRHSPREVIEALDIMVKKGILKTIRRKTAQGVMIYYAFAPIATLPSPVMALTASEYSDSSYFLNINNDTFDELHAFALELCDREGLRRELFEDFNLYQRSKNNRSFDWCAEFERWVRKEIASNAPVIASQQTLAEAKPTTEEFEMAQYFIRHLSSIDPQFEEPFDVMSWAAQIKLLIETGGYTLLDVKAVIDWLFSAKGDWFRPNVPDAYHLRKHFKRLIAHTRSFRDGKPRLPDGVDLFDLYEQM
ncbi:MULTISPECIES: hypothetical protein [unclassified Sulfuricurvum]|uniref:hypothetical protein n=1 Tax=unclassified Sulfuricurvum TaxID=2632390 RepID=UPI000299778F|nr:MULTISPECIES: hypothetical protein [unclassified Sulfuricurvum]AFV98578.1 hypothetical protein B649_11335 [Candidatus Sulfuricurvum sp. RIFRC-1]